MSLILLVLSIAKTTSWMLFSSDYNDKSYARANGQYADELRKRIMGRINGYTKSNANTYYKGQFENYGKRGHLGYTSSNGFSVLPY